MLETASLLHLVPPTPPPSKSRAVSMSPDRFLLLLMSHGPFLGQVISLCLDINLEYTLPSLSSRGGFHPCCEHTLALSVCNHDTQNNISTKIIVEISAKMLNEPHGADLLYSMSRSRAPQQP